ncbi:hypothetical protein [Propionispira raffinosivorans]|uniref:hypothetical protein n=1 Tax=Propionispira raffinosivorans TaxID=86959 RepID=UPI00037026CC|nr:hypothetical protein [Propionispira raffinosivorans]
MKKNDKRVLFIHIQFYEYNKRIQDKISELGYSVDCFCEDPELGILDKIIQKLKPNHISIKSEKMQKCFIDILEKKKIGYDYIFVIKGEKLTKQFLLELKELNPKAKFIEYVWDDVARIANFFVNQDIYDEIYSFDKKDAEQYGLKFLPLFFCDEFRNHDDEKDIGVYFSGWDHSDRRQLLEKIIPVLKKNKISFYFHLYAGKWQALKEKIKKGDFSKEPDYIKYNKLPLKENAKLTLRSRILIDIQHPTQHGLTMRTIEALSGRSKLITTNRDIVEYDFYRSDNILIIDRENLVIDPEFLKKPYANISAETVERYSLSNWLKTILDGKECGNDKIYD